MGLGQSDFSAGRAPIITAVSKEQADTAYQNAQDALMQQKALAQALQGQGTQGMGYQTQLGQALSQQAQGLGPNPVQAKLAENTAANTANQAALMAGQRGASSNAGLIARQAAQQGAATQQQMVGQAATLGAQQQLAAQQQLQNLAGTQIGQNQGSTGAYNQAAQGEQSNILNAIGQLNNSNVSMQNGMNNANAQIAQTNANASGGMFGGLLNAGGAAAQAFFAEGGVVKENPKLGQVPKSDRFDMPEHVRGMAEIYHPHILKMAYGGNIYGGVNAPAGLSMEEGSAAPIANGNRFNTEGLSSAISSMGSGDEEEEGEKPGGGGGAGANSYASFLPVNAAKGMVVPGTPKVDHNTTKNDVVPALLTPKEIVLPISVTQAEDAPEKAKQFVSAILEKQGGGSKDHEEDFKQALKTAMAQRKKK